MVRNLPDGIPDNQVFTTAMASPSEKRGLSDVPDDAVPHATITIDNNPSSIQSRCNASLSSGGCWFRRSACVAYCSPPTAPIPRWVNIAETSTRRFIWRQQAPVGRLPPSTTVSIRPSPRFILSRIFQKMFFAQEGAIFVYLISRTHLAV